MRSLFLITLLTFSCWAQEAEVQERVEEVVEEEVMPVVEERLENGDFNIFGDNAEEDVDFFEFIPRIPDEIEVISEGGSVYNSEDKTLHFQDKVVIKGDSGLIIYADEAMIHIDKEEIEALGNVSVFSGPVLYHGDEVVYRYKLKEIDTKTLRTSHDPYLIEAKSIKTVDKKGRSVQVLEGVKLTTDDFRSPSYWIKADKVSIHPDDTIFMKNLKVQVGPLTVLWLPYFMHSLDSDLGFHFSPGFDSHLGFHIKNRYGFHLGGERDPETLEIKDPLYLANIRVDPYWRRGIGLGGSLLDLRQRRKNNTSLLSFYWIRDRDPTIERTRTDRSDFDQQNRYKLELQDRRDLWDLWGGATRIDSKATFLSDQFFLEDYEERRYRVDPEPDNTVFITHTRERSVSTLATRFQLNSFFETDSRLPEFTHDFVKSRLWNSPLLYEGHFKVGNYQRSFSDDQRAGFRTDLSTATDPLEQDRLNLLLDENNFFRAHTWHEVSAPVKVKSGVRVTPRIGVGYTHYLDNENDVNDGRFISQLGLDFSAKLSRNYRNISNETLGLKGIGHRIQPYINLSYIEASNPDLTGIETLDIATPITRPRPVNVGRVSAIDELASQFIIRNGIRQSIFTKRNGSPYEWLYLDTFMDFLPSEEIGDDRFSNLYNELIFRPLPWFSFSIESQLPVSDSADNFQEVYINSAFLVGKSTNINLSYQFLENHPIVNDITQLNYGAYHRINDKWGLGFSHSWRLDRDLLTMQRYDVSRNLKSWVVTAGLFRRDFEIDSAWGVNLGISLRDFPEISLPFSFGGDR